MVVCAGNPNAEEAGVGLVPGSSRSPSVVYPVNSGPMKDAVSSKIDGI